ncbi:MAG: IS4 family transposase [Nitrososphaerales archaeon]
MTPRNHPQLTKILRLLEINELAKQTGFCARKARKINAEDLVTSFYHLVGSDSFNLRQWAYNLSLLSNSTISFQAIAKRLDYRQETFFQSLFQKCLLLKLQEGLNYPVQEIFRSFNHVLIEDSTCFNLPRSLFEFFPGARLPHGRKAGGRIQLCMNIKDHTYHSIVLQSYCQNDASFAGNILQSIQQGDLIIRDLGYWSIPTMANIHKKEANFLTRFRLTNKLFCPTTKEPIDLERYLRKQDQMKNTQVDIPCLLGHGYQFPVRFVAIKSSDKQTEQRIRSAKKQRHKNCPISSRSKYLMSWSLYVTNVSGEVLSIQDIQKAYQIRWHIEMMFKSWKGKFNLNSFFKNCKGRNPVKPNIILLLILSWLVLNFMKTFNHLSTIVWEKFQRILSPMRYASYLITHPEIISKIDDPMTHKMLAYYSSYDKRKDRKNHFEKTYMISLS